MKIGTKILGCSLSVILLIGAVSVYSSAVIHQDLENIFEEFFSLEEALETILHNLEEEHEYIEEYQQGIHSLDDANKKFSKIDKTINQNLKLLLDTDVIPSDDTQELDELINLNRESRMNALEQKPEHHHHTHADNNLKIKIEMIDNGLHEYADQLRKGIVILLQFNYVAIVIVIVLSITISYLLSRSISKKIICLQHVTKSIIEGKLKTRVDIDGNDEMSHLAIDVNSMAESLEQQERDKDEFISMVAHELKTPLVPIHSYCDMLKSGMLGELDERQKRVIGQIFTSANDLLILINNLLNVQKLGMSKMSFNIESVLLVEFIQDIHESIQPIMVEKNIEFIKDSSNISEDITIIADITKLREIFTNLLQNSVDFVVEDTGIIEIGMYNETPNDVTLYVKDNGKGMTEEQQQKIFTKFYQVDTSSTRKHGGTGLGLSVCQGYIENMNGKIWVKSTRGVETVFYFTLPKKKKTF